MSTNHTKPILGNFDLHRSPKMGFFIPNTMITFKIHFKPFNYIRSIEPEDCAIPQVGDYVCIEEFCNEIIDADGLDNTKQTHAWLGKYFVVDDRYWESIEDGILNLFLCPPDKNDMMRSQAQLTTQEWASKTEQVIP